MKKLTSKEINYILGLKKTKFDWMFEGTIEELDNGYGYHLVVYMKKPVFNVIRFVITPFVFVYLVLQDGIEEAKEDLRKRFGRDIAHFYFHINESTKKEYEKVKIVIQSKGE